MIISKPKSSIMVSIGILIIALLAVDGWLFYALVQSPESNFWLKLILTPTLLVIIIAIARRGYTSSLRLTIGNNKLSYKHFLGSEKSCNISDVKSWHEELVKQKNGDYKQLTFVLANGKVIQLSNQENSEYQRVLSYIKKKVKVTKG